MLSIGADIIYTGSRIQTKSWINFSEQGNILSISSEPKGDELGKFPVITPAFIDPHCHIGMDRAGEPGNEGEANEKLDSIVALADALDSVQMDDTSFNDSIEMGVLYSCVVPGSGNIIGGRSAVIRNYATDTNSALIGRAGLKAAFGYNPMSTRDWKGTRPYTRMGCLALLRDALREVQNKAGNSRKNSELNPKQKVLLELLQRKTVLRVHVHKSDDIAALLRMVDEFKLKVTVEHACNVHNPTTFRELARRRIPLVYGPLDSFAYKTELRDENWRNIAGLLAAKIDFGLMTDHPVLLQRNLILTLRWFLRLGCDKTTAIGIVTRQNAKIIGLDKQLGTLAKGKWASFIAWNGDPFDLAAYPVSVYGEGQKLFQC